ncbi:polysaccharide biosynthesis protein [Pistricoccus aurantiacus]|uniref:Polysaccharide biosynthesis protein n=1 Tax=Pistricoccus aurantiacus TaxID=1883414 RepID=A0A5B8SZ43_9GAMM|nr:nucleoside-diphosphate sugar epimerase/dehydratase [Pistricoccus aurantiacus]QEA40083.1 polysaccharide biosynthesis protein [Pistricoccus aurantiacus]
MIPTLETIFRLPRYRKRLILLTLDAVLLCLSILAAWTLRLESLEPLSQASTWWLLAITVPLSLVLFSALGLYRAVLRYMSYRTIQQICLGVVGSMTILALGGLLLQAPLPRSVPFIYLMLAILSLGGGRIFLRGIYQNSRNSKKIRVAVYGAGSAGSQLVRAMRQDATYLPVAFIDDWRGMHTTFVEGIKVYPPTKLPELIEKRGVAHILLAIPSTSMTRRREILESLQEIAIPVRTVPVMADVISGRAKINEVRDVAVEDLLGRDPVPPRQDLLAANIEDKVVMVTGAGGSIGSELCRQIQQLRPRRLLLLDSSEYALYQIEKELEAVNANSPRPVEIMAFLGSVQNQRRLSSLLDTFRVQTIYHAAAYKHVPMVEHNAAEGIRNNVFGTLRLAQAAIAAGVETFVLISTDKAVRPTNIMGASKRLAEQICQALANHQSGTRFCMVRFGNVLGSSGSVVPLFRRQIDAGGPITVTDPRITRYFMTIPEAAQLVIQAGAMGRGGDVFVLDMGESVQIADLASKMVRLSGLQVKTPENPDGDIEIVYTGLRPGEKLYEELLIADRDVVETEHPRIRSANEAYWEWSRLKGYLQRLDAATSNATAVDLETLRDLLKEPETGYQPKCQITDLEWEERRSRAKLLPYPTTSELDSVDQSLDEREPSLSVRNGSEPASIYASIDSKNSTSYGGSTALRYERSIKSARIRRA